MKKKKKLKFGIVGKIVSVTLIPMVILVILSILTMRDIGEIVAERMVEAQLKTSAYSVKQLATTSLAEESDQEIESVMEIVGAETQVNGILFAGSRLISSNMTDTDGNPLKGVMIPDDVYRKLQSGEKVFIKDYELGGISYFGYFDKFAELAMGQPLVAFVCVKTDDIVEIYASAIDGRVIFTAIATAIAMQMVLVVLLRICKALKKSIEDVVKVSEGNLNFAVSNKLLKRGDEVGDMSRIVQSLVDNLHGIVNNLNASSDSLDAFAEQFKRNFGKINESIGNVNVAVEEIARGATDQANEVQVVLDQMAGMADAIDSTSTNVEALMDSAESMQAQNNLMNSTLDELVAISDRTTGSIKTVYEQTNNTNKSAMEIRNAIEIITDIASQTNLLSLNASIEAARAGEQGRGFAVVADQVRTLADQSSESANVISAIVEELIKNSNVSVDTMNQVLEVLHTQEDKLADTRKVFSVLNEEISNVTSAVENISSQVDAIGQVKDGVQTSFDSLAAISEENAASTEETSASMHELSCIIEECNATAGELMDISEHLEEDVKKFKL